MNTAFPSSLTIGRYLTFSAYPGYGSGTSNIYYNQTNDWIRFETSHLNIKGNLALHEGNYSSYALPLYGGGLSGEVYIKNGTLERGVNPSNRVSLGRWWYDKNTKPLGGVEFVSETGGTNFVAMWVLSNTSTSTGNEYGGIYAYKTKGVSGNKYAVFNANTGTFSADTFVGSLTGHASLDLSLSGGTMTGTIISPGDDSVAMRPAVNGNDYIGSSSYRYWMVYALDLHGNLKDTNTTSLNLYPQTTNTYSCGTSGNTWKYIYGRYVNALDIAGTGTITINNTTKSCLYI